MGPGALEWNTMGSGPLGPAPGAFYMGPRAMMTTQTHSLIVHPHTAVKCTTVRDNRCPVRDNRCAPYGIIGVTPYGIIGFLAKRYQTGPRFALFEATYEQEPRQGPGHEHELVLQIDCILSRFLYFSNAKIWSGSRARDRGHGPGLPWYCVFRPRTG